MIHGVQLKVCGQTRAEDARVAAELGADFLGFILYPKSPRHVSLKTYAGLARELPAGPKRVAVMVEPNAAELDAAVEAGFDFFQLHARHDLESDLVRVWSARVGAERLWLAPKLPPGEDVPAGWLPLARTFLLDTFHTEGFGGSGRTGDWEKFARHQTNHRDKTWVLAGGLSPANVAEAIGRSGARFVDVNSGVESDPGVKDHAKLRALVTALAG